MPIKCYEKPNRTKKRPFTAKACGRIVCYAIEDGASRKELEEEIDKCLDDGSRRKREGLCVAAFRLLGLLVLAAGAAIIIFGAAGRVYKFLLALVGLVRRFLPASVRRRLDQLEKELVAELKTIEGEFEVLRDDAEQLLLEWQRTGGDSG